MSYQSTCWVNNYSEYGAGLNSGKTWPQVMEQYRKPQDLRHYDLPTEPYSHGDKLFYTNPKLQHTTPMYRGRWRDSPATRVVTSYHPSGVENKPAGFHGRVYYEHGPPQFKYQGPQLDKLYWLERLPYLPSMTSKPHGQQIITNQAATQIRHGPHKYNPDISRTK